MERGTVESVGGFGELILESSKFLFDLCLFWGLIIIIF
jgi:hypothetical protein